MPVVPHRFLFRYSIPVRRIEQASRNSGLFLDLEEAALIPDLGALEGATPFAKVRTGWNEDGIGFRVEVARKKMPLVAVPDEPRESDGFQVWLDTRNTQSIHRASRFCHHFAFLPGEKKIASSAHQLALALAKEDAPSNRAGLLRTASQSTPVGYVLDAWIPAESLHGYDPESNPLLGFYYVVRDAELGEQFLTVGRDFPFDHDPSLWSTLDLKP